MTTSWTIEAHASVPVGGMREFQLIGAGGDSSPFSIPAGQAFVVKDTSIQRLSSGTTNNFFIVALEQDLGVGGTINRWAFVGTETGNIERAFESGITFKTPFKATNSSLSADVVVVRLFGYFTAG